LGVLAKGLIGLVIPGAVLLVWLLVLRRWRVVPRLLWWPGPLLFTAIAVPWFVAMQARFPAFLDYFFVVQHFKRFAAGGFNNVQPFWFYPAVLLLFSLPGLPWLARLPRPWHADPLRALLMVWAAVVVVFFSLPASKLVGYVLPAVPPLAALMAEGLMTALGRSPRLRRLGWASVALPALVSVGVVLALAWRPLHTARELGAALAARASPQDAVIALGAYPYDLPFYARLAASVVVVADWSDPAVRARDDWHKELADAGDFAPAAARQNLIQATALPALLCRHRVNWLIGTPAATAPWAKLAEPVHSERDATLWQLDTTRPATASLLGCVQTPNAGLPGR
jgi:4-amino-4-deoxy-L-arabinose transferase-like glycosyltransferase